MSLNTQAMQLVSAADARSFVEQVLTGNGVPKINAAIVAKCLVEADLRGVDTHGIYVVQDALMH
jgi:LDH2 family malate/lactate/ureidoglycolate dehydrogenase